MKNLLDHKWEFLLLLVIIAIGIFLRGYNFSNWLHFELDQARDARVVDLAIAEGPENLPLLGPRAGGSFLRLGPVFYYFQYLSALVFGSTPDGMAMFVLIFGILALPVFYLFVRRYFERTISLGLLAIFATSIFLVVYSRFSWNPNPLPLFVLLTLYSLLRLVDHEERHRGLWMLLGALSLGIATQLHFLAFIGMPAIAFIFLIIKRPRINIRYWLGAFFIIVFLYVPAIINDIKTGGDNIGQFIETTFKKSGDANYSLANKVIRNYTEQSVGQFLVLSGREETELPLIKRNPTTRQIEVICKASCQKNLWLGIAGFSILSLGILLLVWGFFKEKEKKHKDFLLLNFIWFMVAFGIFTPLAFSISPRFFLLIAGLPFVFLGLILEGLTHLFRYQKAKIFLMVVVIGIFLVSNGLAIFQRFTEIEKSSEEAITIGTDKILKERSRVTLGQQYQITEYLEGIQQENGYPLYIKSDPFYTRAFLYHLEKKNILREELKSAEKVKRFYQEGNYFLIFMTQSNLDRKVEEYLQFFDLVDKKEFGTLTVFQIYPRKKLINNVRQDFSSENGDSQDVPGVPVRFRWEEIFSSFGEGEVEE